jgi:hypothetical protein
LISSIILSRYPLDGAIAILSLLKHINEQVFMSSDARAWEEHMGRFLSDFFEDKYRAIALQEVQENLHALAIAASAVSRTYQVMRRQRALPSVSA